MPEFLLTAFQDPEVSSTRGEAGSASLERLMAHYALTEEEQSLVRETFEGATRRVQPIVSASRGADESSAPTTPTIKAYRSTAKPEPIVSAYRPI
jgi:hypothetical protein